MIYLDIIQIYILTHQPCFLQHVASALLIDEILSIGIELIDQSQASVQPQIQNISGRVDDQVPSPLVAWQDPTLWSSYLPSAVPVFFDEVKKYLKASIYSLFIICFSMPQNVIILIIQLEDWKCEVWGSFVEQFMYFQLIFFVLYPYFVKLKLDNNLW